MTLEIGMEVDEEWDSSTDWPGLARRAAEAAIEASAFPWLASAQRPVELSVVLTGDEQVKALNSQWRGKDRPTNVLSFPLADPKELAETGAEGPELMLGDLVLAHGVCVREAQEKRLALQDHAAHLFVHGTFHLLGYGHEEDESAEMMEALEIKALHSLGIADPYREAC